MQDRWLALGIGAATLALFVWNRLRVEVVGLLAMLALILSGLVTPAAGISGFANEAVLTIGAMFVLTAGLTRTGAVELLARWLANAAGSDLWLLVTAIALVVPLSAFVNNTPVVAVMVPVVLGICRQRGNAPSRILMPISFASQLGGTLTLIGTSTNLLVAGIVAGMGLPKFGLFTATGPAALLMIAGIVYLLTVGRWLLPTRAAGQDPVQTYELRDYLATLQVKEGSELVGRSLRDVKLLADLGLDVLAIERDGSRRVSPGSDAVLHAGDRLLVEGKVKELARAHADADLVVVTDRAALLSIPLHSDVGAGRPAAGEADAEEWQWAELIVPPRSPLIGRSLADAALAGRYGVRVLGIRHETTSMLPGSGDVRLRQGDLLLVQALPSALRRIHASRDLSLLGALDVPANRRHRLGIATGVMVLVVVSAALGFVPILVAALAGCAAMFVTGCLRPEEAYEDIDWSVLVLIATLLPFGTAMQATGAAALIADAVLSVAGPFGPHAALFATYLLTSLLTEVISNSAAAVGLAPIAVATGHALGVSPLPFVVAVMLAGSNSFMTPVGYQTNMFVFGPGGYRFSDFVRVGGPLCLVMAVLATIVIPWFFPLLPG